MNDIVVVVAAVLNRHRVLWEKLASFSSTFTQKKPILLLLESLLRARGAVRLTILTWLSEVPKCVSRICPTITHLFTPSFLPMHLSMFFLLSYKDIIYFGYESHPVNEYKPSPTRGARHQSIGDDRANNIPTATLHPLNYYPDIPTSSCQTRHLSSLLRSTSNSEA
jgi:hypothetical protein